MEHPGATPPGPYGTPATPLVTVRGEAHHEVDPETAAIEITVTARGTDRRATLADLTTRNQRVLDLVRGYGEAVEKTETGALAITPRLTAKGRHERVGSYHGTVRTTATLADFTALGELTTRLADLDLTTVAGPWWALRPDSPAHRDARRRAVHDAVRRAREYAEALGARLVALLELADHDTDLPGPFPRAGTMRAARFGAPEPEAPAALDLEPQRQTVHAQVTARFTLTPPTL
ncbi:SIMPL domain-containing protein [Streptomyces pactum]|uniref:SIMPL domain-containing protein n=1 Tax=Streptomyces pactum TaxID=68249 RepID=A0ABS0NGV4_9ACTN|nr:SIMPL domain-containing protein [Streptomyces pactum]MBH5334339.1 SIMPL domain-containing protein [Streptomyces pactum]